MPRDPALHLGCRHDAAVAGDSWPPRKRTKVGIARMPSRAETSCSSSLFTLRTRSSPAFLRPRSAKMGAAVRQGPHQGAQKSARTGTGEFRTAASSWAPVTARGSPETSRSALHLPQTGAEPGGADPMRLRAPQWAQRCAFIEWKLSTPRGEASGVARRHPTGLQARGPSRISQGCPGWMPSRSSRTAPPRPAATRDSCTCAATGRSIVARMGPGRMSTASTSSTGPPSTP